jgi:hypothetical protein
MGFWGSIFGGQNKTLDAGIKKAGQVSDFSTGMGENLLTKTGSFISDLLSGDASKQMQLLAPQVGAAKERGAQGKKTLAEFGNRSGGNAAASASIDNSTRSDITNMISSLTGSALGAGSSLGQGLLDTGINALDKSVSFSQEQMQNWSDSILGRGITTGAAFGESYGMGKIPGGQKALDSMNAG